MRSNEQKFTMARLQKRRLFDFIETEDLIAIANSVSVMYIVDRGAAIGKPKHSFYLRDSRHLVASLELNLVPFLPQWIVKKMQCLHSLHSLIMKIKVLSSTAADFGQAREWRELWISTKQNLIRLKVRKNLLLMKMGSISSCGFATTAISQK